MRHWQLNSYQRPYLAIDEIFIDQKKVVTIQKNGISYEIYHTDSSLPATAILDAFHDLRDPDGEIWPLLKSSSEVPKIWIDIIRRMDELGLLAEADDGGSSLNVSEQSCTEQCIESTVEWLNTSIEIVDRKRLLNNVRRLLREGQLLLQHHSLECLVGQSLIERSSTKLSSLEILKNEPNFYLRILLYQMRYWKQGSPLSLACAVLTLSDFEERLVGKSRRTLSPRTIEYIHSIIAYLLGGLYEMQDIKEHLNSLSAILLLSVGPFNQRISFVPPSNRSPKSGINLMLEAEQVALQILNQLGTTRYFEALSKGVATKKLACGTYIEQYHITRRFVEAITPMMAKRLRKGVRNQIFEYYADEVGHEVFELNACAALGVDKYQIIASIPLPLSVAYIDVFTYISQIDPIGFLLSFIGTEGLPGTRTLVNEYFEKYGLIGGEDYERIVRQHEKLNVDHNHTMLARNMLVEIPYVGVANQLIGLDHLAFMLELGFKSWDLLYRYYGNPTMPLHYNWLGMRPHELLADETGAT